MKYNNPELNFENPADTGGTRFSSRYKNLEN